ncbi:hypothetical protein [uncultured Tateyamaria sp.]|uniref:hypothetical protein n=1 Tax=uncultured Tateyamaria sp. TaxID=455651 RepID=UPI002628C6DE|nr:hypothetical protein [uncultured Tateyamaria sp.]
MGKACFIEQATIIENVSNPERADGIGPSSVNRCVAKKPAIPTQSGFQLRLLSAVSSERSAIDWASAALH